MKLILLLAMQFCFVSNLFAQNLRDTLQEVKIKSKRKIAQDDRINSFSPGQKIMTIDSSILQQYKMQNVANLLSQQTPVFIKSYGLNGLATLNFRGSSAAQSQVYWNGIPIQNAALGIADISLLPVSLMQNLQIIYGSSAALWGSGNVGGALMMESEMPIFGKKNPSYELALGAGSFGQYQAVGKVGWSSQKISFNTSVFLQSAKNNFDYTDLYGAKQNNANAKLQGLSIQPQLAYKLNEKNTIRLAIWYQKYYREIPAALFESGSVKNRNDASLRMLLDWKKTSNTSSSYVRNSFTKELMTYDDEAATQHYKNNSYQYYFEVGHKKYFGLHHQILLFTPIQLTWMKIADTTFYQSKFALAAAYRYNNLNQKFITSINVRAELINSQSILLPGINISYSFCPQFQLRSNIQKTYRAPTLNELYYQPGGNVNLKPEQGWTEEIGYHYSTNILNKINFFQDFAAFNRQINDWILWLGGAVWTPHNIASVQSRGLEMENLVAFSVSNNIKIKISYKASYVLATTISSFLPNDGSIGKQIPYTPKFNSIFNLAISYKSLTFSYINSFTGLRYVNIDETDPIQGYAISNIQLAYLIPLKNKKLGFNFQVNNLFDKTYFVVKSRPMPGTNYLIGVFISSK